MHIPRIRYSWAMSNLRLETGRLALLVMTSVLSLSGCKDENVDVSGYVDAWSKKVCDAVIDCNCEYPGGAQYDHCLSQLSVGAETQAELLDVEGLTFDGACAQRQVDDVGRLGCGVFVPDPDAKCEAPCKVWYGPVHAGGTCTVVNGYDNCNQGLSCNGNVCVHPCAEPDLPKLGESCSTQYGCDDGLWCDALSTPLLPVCAALPAVGEACLPAELGFACAEELICDTTDPQNPTCAALPGLDEECPVGACADDLYCDNSAAPAVCTMLPGLGDPCPMGICAAPNLCELGVCLEPRPQVCGFYGGVPEGLGEGSGGGDTMPTTGVTAGDGSGDASTGFDTGLETGTGGLGADCCTPHGTPACDDLAIATCVCELEPSCCTDPWGAACVESVGLFECGTC